MVLLLVEQQDWQTSLGTEQSPDKRSFRSQSEINDAFVIDLNGSRSKVRKFAKVTRTKRPSISAAHPTNLSLAKEFSGPTKIMASFIGCHRSGERIGEKTGESR